ncbi:MAG: hypothetical protein Q9212_003606 [Teloschistes hypoglaucus]
MIPIPPMALLMALFLFVFAFPPALIIYWTSTHRDDANHLMVILVITILIIPIVLMLFWWFNAVWIAKRFFRPYHRMDVRTRRRLGGEEELGVEMVGLTRAREFVDGLVVVERGEGKGKGKEKVKDNGKGKGKA